MRLGRSLVGGAEERVLAEVEAASMEGWLPALTGGPLGAAAARLAGLVCQSSYATGGAICMLTGGPADAGRDTVNSS